MHAPAAGLQWFVVAVAPRREFAVERDIMDLGYETYIPRMTRRVIYRGRRLTRVEPLLSGYLFVQFDRALDAWGAIESCDDVWGLIKNDARPCSVAAGELELLRRAEGAGVFDYSRPGANFAEGDDVEILDGHTLSGLRAKVRYSKDKKKIKLILNFLGVAEIDPMFLRKV